MQTEVIVIAVSLVTIVISLAILAVVIVRYGKEDDNFNRHWEVEMWSVCYGRRIDLQFYSQLVLGRAMFDNVFDGKNDITISREQCMLYENYDQIYVWNMSTVNPTVINGQRLNIPQRLRPGDRLEMGKSVFLITRVQLVQDYRPL